MHTDSSLYDVGIIGSGPGGYIAAIKASQLGLKVALIEKYSKLGGSCLHWCCIPTKALLFNAELYERALNGREFGILYNDINLDLRLVKARKDKVIKKLATGIEFLMKKNKVTVIKGKGALIDRGKIQVEGDNAAEVHAKNIIVATGSNAVLLPGLEVDGQYVFTNREMFELDSVPKSLLIVGAGAVGIEFASIFSRFGTNVTVIEMMPRILPSEDVEVSEELRRILTRRRIKLLTETRLENIFVRDGNVHAETVNANGEVLTIIAEKALIAVGRRPVSDDIGLERLHVATSKGCILVDNTMESNIPGIFAIGDVIPTQQLAHVASREGIVAVCHIAGQKPEPLNYDMVPNCTYCKPEVASVGLTERAARERGYDVITSKFPFAAIGKPAILGETEGFVKLVCEKQYKQILGVHMIGPHVTEMISEGSALIGLEATAGDLSDLIHPHPTVSEGIMEAAHMIYSGAALNF
ncbi:MAG: Dihydrolipoamide dehydrogenase of branched-chain alpha-keto acid dehydrogenase [Acidobacteria bacterium]|nr:Dihydrolipoamide dehydrogenase of branched-chain alpha-keto acid dehydrogenase [Acidobacteriota bacterium]